MKKLASICTVAVVASVGLLHAQASNSTSEQLAIQQQDRLDAADCSNETLKGIFGVSLSGTRPAPPPAPPGTIEQVLGIVTQTFNGDGTFTQISTDKGSVSGVVANRAGTGTYTVNADCSGTTTLNIPGLPFPIVNDIVIVNHGKEIHAFVASPQAVMVSSVGIKK